MLANIDGTVVIALPGLPSDTGAEQSERLY